jgi:protein-disulfide isomerase
MAEVVHPQSARPIAASAIAGPQEIARYVRDRFMIRESVRLTAAPLSNSQFPVFYKSTVTSDDGKQRRADEVFISKDGRCFVLGNVFAIPHGSTDEIIRCVREVAKLPPQTELKVGSFSKTPYPGLLKSVITASDGRKRETKEIFLTDNRRTGILGIVLPFRKDFVQGMIKTKDQPGVGSRQAPVTIVEYADLQCPICARLHEFLQKEFLPKYGDNVRVIFKEFPLPYHDWSRSAAIANECVYQISPSMFPDYRTSIFANQNAFTASNVRDQLLSLGDQAGIDRSRLAACIDSKASLWRVEAGRQEGEDLGVDRTPTSFVNGRIVIGLPPENIFNKIVDDALLAARRGRTAARSSTR